MFRREGKVASYYMFNSVIHGICSEEHPATEGLSQTFEKQSGHLNSYSTNADVGITLKENIQSISLCSVVPLIIGICDPRCCVML